MLWVPIGQPDRTAWRQRKKGPSIEYTNTPGGNRAIP